MCVKYSLFCCSVAADDQVIDLHCTSGASEFSLQTPFLNPAALPASGAAWLHSQNDSFNQISYEIVLIESSGAKAISKFNW